VAEDVAVLVHDAPLPDSFWEELGGALGKPNAGIRGDQPDTLNPRSLRCLRNALQPVLSSFAPS
jgi:hypothetical protein